MTIVKQTPPCSPEALPTTLQPYLPPRSFAYHPATMQAPLAVSIAGQEPCCFHIGESSGEDDGDPNVATGDERAPPQGSTAPRWRGTSDGGRGGTRGGQAPVWQHGGRHGCRATGLHGGVCFNVAITWSFF
jgi:hypothetical protein